MNSVHYSITPSQPRAHLFTVSCTVSAPDPKGQVLSLPAWTPGSYLVRDFARHILRFEAESNGQPLAVRKSDKASWHCAPCTGSLTVHYDVYARDDSVRAAWLDATRSFFNGNVVFVRIHGQESTPLTVAIERPVGIGSEHWRVATTLDSAGADPLGFGLYSAANYTDLIDHPVEMGMFDLIEFRAGGVLHQMALTGRHRADTRRLAADLSLLCAEQQALFGLPVPMQHYLFLTRVVKQGYGGLEHRDSCALICARDDLPKTDVKKPSRSYQKFLGLCSHEYFHLWNVKRIQPQAFAESDLRAEAYTEDLWAYEGVTSYYDDLSLLRAGLIDLPAYCECLAQAATHLWQTPGRYRQSLAASSFDAWTKFYRPDENTPNAVVSYYTKGALVALCLDLKLRLETEGRWDLDQLMRILWQRYGMTGLPVPERTLETLAQELSGLDLRDFFESLIRGTDDPPLADLLPAFGIEAQLCDVASNGECCTGVTLGLRFAVGSAQAQIQYVLAGTPAQLTGLTAGDVLVALDGLRLGNVQDLDRLLQDYVPGDRVKLHVFRRDELMEFEVVLIAREADTWRLCPKVDADARALARRRAWLRQS